MIFVHSEPASLFEMFCCNVVLAPSRGQTETGVPVQESTGGPAPHNRGKETEAERRT